MSEPVVVFRTHSDIEASIVRGLLDSHGLSAFVSSDVPNAIFPMSVKGLGGVRVSVPAPEAETAMKLIDDFRRDSPRSEVIAFPDDVAPLEARLEAPVRRPASSSTARSRTARARTKRGCRAAADNESLEFLGDAVLGLVVADLLYREFPDFDEGRKSKIKAALVSRGSLAGMGERLGLGAAIRLGRGEEKTGGRTKQALIANACEAVLAALYLDGGLEAAQALIVTELGPVLDRLRRPGLLTALTGDFKSALQEWLHGRDEVPIYHTLAETGPDHRKSFDVEVRVGDRALGRAEGYTRKEAEQGAARAALVALGAIEG